MKVGPGLSYKCAYVQVKTDRYDEPAGRSCPAGSISATELERCTLASRVAGGPGIYKLSVTLEGEGTLCVASKPAGLDMGWRNVAVVNCNGETLFFNDDHVAYMRRRLCELRRRLGKRRL